MVNVGGRSKGCSTCRRRRVKCDESRPICKRCERCGFECEGAKDIAFVEGKILKSRRTDRQTTVSTRRDARDTNYVNVQIPASLSLRGMEIEIYTCYARQHLTRGAPVYLALEETGISDIINSRTSTANGQIFHQAFLSFAIVFFGARHRQACITAQGYAIYGTALRCLNQELSDSKCYTRDEVILSVATLAMLECFVPTGPKQYLNHMTGLERLLELRDPAIFYSPKSSQLYKGVREMILFASLRTGKPSVLAKHEWKAAFRSSCSDEKMLGQDLFDFLADCTVLLAERDMVVGSCELSLERNAQHSQQQHTLKRRSQTLLGHLRDWRQRWDSDESNSYFETSATFARLQQETWGEDSPPFLTTFEFSNDHAATMLMFYNTVLVYVLQVLASLPLEKLDIQGDQIFVEKTPQNTGYVDDAWKHSKDGYVAAERLAALEVCRCIPYHLRQRLCPNGASPPVVVLALMTAWRTLRGKESAEGRWMSDVLNTTSREVIAKGLWQTEIKP